MISCHQSHCSWTLAKSSCPEPVESHFLSLGPKAASAVFSAVRGAAQICSCRSIGQFGWQDRNDIHWQLGRMKPDLTGTSHLVTWIVHQYLLPFHSRAHHHVLGGLPMDGCLFGLSRCPETLMFRPFHRPQRISTMFAQHDFCPWLGFTAAPELRSYFSRRLGPRFRCRRISASRPTSPATA